MDTQKEIEDMLVAGVINEDDFFGVVKAIKEHPERSMFSHHAKECTEVIDQYEKDLGIK